MYSIYHIPAYTVIINFNNKKVVHQKYSVKVFAIIK